jgi:MYXO-CTERM domain-containing protein
VFSGAHLCPADTILTASPSETVSPGTPVDALELMEPGIDPNLFLFTGNTMWDYNGIYQLEIIGADIDPSQTDTLDGVPAWETLINLGDGTGDGSGTASNSDMSSQAGVPEPASFGFGLLGVLLLAARRRSAGKVPVAAFSKSDSFS